MTDNANKGTTGEVSFLQSKFMDDAILVGDHTSTGISSNALASNLTQSGQLGIGVKFTKLDGATPAVFNPVVCIVLNTPSMWDRYPKLQEMLRAIVETHAKTISGIDFGYTLETTDTPVGHDGQTLKVPTRTTRGAVNPSITVPEYPGMPVYNLFKQWIFDIQHPDTNASALPANIGDKARLADGDIPGWFMSAYSMSMICIQYDPSGLPDRIYDACVITNMFPTEIGEIGFERSIGQTKPMERSINFSGLVQHNEMTKALGISVAKMLNMHKVNYNFALPGLAGTDIASAEKLGSAAFTGSGKNIIENAGIYSEVNDKSSGAIAKYKPDNIQGGAPKEYSDSIGSDAAFATHSGQNVQQP